MPNCPDLDAIQTQLPMLLPPGPASQSDDNSLAHVNSYMNGFFRAISDELYNFDQAICKTFTEFYCHSADEDIDLWQAEYGIPDECDPFADDLCGKVSSTGEIGGNLTYLASIAERLGWLVSLEYLKGAHPDFPGIRSTLLLEIDAPNSPALLITDFENWEIPGSPVGDLGESDIDPLICTYERVLPAHIGFVWRVRVITMLSVITDETLATGLELALDAGDGDSWPAPGTGQLWIDTSPQGNDYTLGLTNLATASDPTFNGTANGRSATEFFTFDGGDIFSAPAATSFPNLHKDGAVFTIVAIVKVPAAATLQRIAGTINSDPAAAGATGIALDYAANGKLSLKVRNAGAVVLNATSGDVVSPGAFRFIALSVNEPGGAGASLFKIGEDGNTYFDATYASPAAGASQTFFDIGNSHDLLAGLLAGFQLAGIAVWEGQALDETELEGLRRSMKNRWTTI